MNTEQDILDMQYELMSDRGMQPVEDMFSMSLLYFYSRYRKDRQNAKPNGGKTQKVKNTG
jgi:hypothetical protein